jgi:hypothetical protein
MWATTWVMWLEWEQICSNPMYVYESDFHAAIHVLLTLVDVKHYAGTCRSFRLWQL